MNQLRDHQSFLYELGYRKVFDFADRRGFEALRFMAVGNSDDLAGCGYWLGVRSEVLSVGNVLVDVYRSVEPCEQLHPICRYDDSGSYAICG